MRVVFRRVDERRYEIGVRRDGRHDVGADVAPRTGPGGGPLPHDLVHLAIEEALGLRLGIFGQVAAGGDCGGFFFVAPAERSKLRDARRSRRLSSLGRADADLSERLAALVSEDGVLAPTTLISARAHARVSARLAAVAAAWRSTPVGGELVLEWASRPAPR